MPPVVFGNLTYVHSAISAVADCILAILPMFLVFGLQMNIRTKIIVFAILGLGTLYALFI